jgi:hypothetical protein
MSQKPDALNWTVLAAVAEAAGTGIILFVRPQLFSWLVFGAQLSDAGRALGQLTAIVIVGFVIVSWPAGAEHQVPSVRALMIYNLLAAIYLLYLAIGGNLAGVLLWPAVAVHVALASLLGRVWRAMR